MFSKHHTWLVKRGNEGQELCTIQQDDVGSYGGANVYLTGTPKFGVTTADFIVRVQAGGKDFQVQTKAGRLLAEVSNLSAPISGPGLQLEQRKSDSK